MSAIKAIVVEQEGVGFYTDAATGKSGVCESGLSVLCGTTRQSISKLMKSLTTKQPYKGLECLVGKVESLTTKSETGAEFYEVPNDTVQSAIKNHRAELESDGLKTIRGKGLKDVVSVFSKTSKTPSITVWTPRAAVRLGLMLRDSQVAAFIRNVVLDLVEASNKAVTPEPPQTQAEFLLMFAQQMVTQEKRLTEQERELREQKALLDDLLAGKQSAEEELFALPTADEPANPIPLRGKINMVVRNYAHRIGTGYKAVWDSLYLQMYYRYSYDVKARCRHSGRKKLDQVEADEKLEELFAIASEVLV